MDGRLEVMARPVYLRLVFVAGLVGVQILFLAGLGVILTDLRLGELPPDATNGLLLALLAIGVGFVTVSLLIRRLAVARAFSSHSPAEALAKIRTGIIIACAFAEVPAVLGFTWLILGGSVLWTPVFYGGAAATLALVFPRPSQWQEALATIASKTG